MHLLFCSTVGAKSFQQLNNTTHYFICRVHHFVAFPPAVYVSQSTAILRQHSSESIQVLYLFIAIVYRSSAGSGRGRAEVVEEAGRGRDSGMRNCCSTARRLFLAATVVSSASYSGKIYDRGSFSICFSIEHAMWKRGINLWWCCSPTVLPIIFKG